MIILFAALRRTTNITRTILKEANSRPRGHAIVFNAFYMNDGRCVFASRKSHSCVRLPLLGGWSRFAGDILPEILGRTS